MALLQVREVPEETIRALRAEAGAQGLSLSAFLRRELDRLATRPSNVRAIEQIARRNRSGGPTSDDIVAELRRLRAAS